MGLCDLYLLDIINILVNWLVILLSGRIWELWLLIAYCGSYNLDIFILTLDIDDSGGDWL